MRTQTICWILASLPLMGCGSTVPAPDGLPIAYDDVGSGETTLLLVHGWCCDRTFWREQIAAFAADYRIVAVDLPGHGDSRGTRDPWTVAQLGADVQAVARALDLQRMIIIGHSMGGPVALDVAARMPGRVVAVVGVDTLHNAEMRLTAEMAGDIAAPFAADFPGTMAKMVGTQVIGGPQTELAQWVTQRANRTDRNAALGLIRDYVSVDFRGLLERAVVPVRCINATAPNKTMLEINRRYADFDVILMPDVGHFLMLEQPEAFNAHLRKTLRGLEGKR